MYASIAASLGVLLAGLAITRSEITILRYTIVPLSWEVAITPGGPNVTLNGTVQEVHAQLLQISPRYEADFAISREEALVQPRDIDMPRDTGSHFCYGPRQRCTYGRTLEGVSYLRGVPGRPKLGVGPKTCSRVSCSYMSAIFWCNDHPTEYSLKSFDQIANSAKWIADTCYIDGLTSGQNFEADSWNTVVCLDQC